MEIIHQEDFTDTFLHAEDEAAHSRALDCFQDMLNQHSMDEPSVVLHHLDRALMRGLRPYSPRSPTWFASGI